jgi:3'-phosphoadenosine 5'-phosphosulfate sulfotransferase (PAPS reductase)/FAD synthetase
MSLNLTINGDFKFKNRKTKIHFKKYLGHLTLVTSLRDTKRVYFIANLSGGKDSMAMTDLLRKEGYLVDYIVINDTFLEFPMMYEYIKKIKKYFREKYNKVVISTTPDTTFESWCFGTIKDPNSKFYGAIRGIPQVWSEPCYWRRESKVKPSDALMKRILDNDASYCNYIGYTLDEINRKMKDTNCSYPLIDIFKMREVDCQSYLLDNELENPLYRFFTRTGCGICTGQSERSWYQVYKNFPEIWNYMKFIEERLLYYNKNGMKVKNCYWFTKFRTCNEMEYIFKEKTKSMFDFLDEPLKDCFCKT